MRKPFLAIRSYGSLQKVFFKEIDEKALSSKELIQFINQNTRFKEFFLQYRGEKDAAKSLISLYGATNKNRQLLWQKIATWLGLPIKKL